MTDQAVRGGASSAGRATDSGRGPGEAAAGLFVGRDREKRELRADIGRAGLSTLSGRPAPHSRVLLIAGRPGSGRTALARELAAELAGDYPDGVLHARLTGPGGAAVPTERTARDLLATLGAAPPVAGADEDELTGDLRDELARRRALLLLDDVADGEQVLDLLPDNRDCLVIAVAAGPLAGVSDVRPCALGGLDRTASVELLRARAGVTPRITVDPRRAESLAEACGDLPAALCLVGGWLAARPKLSVSDAIQALEAVPLPEDGRPLDVLTRAFRLVCSGLPGRAARLLRLLPLAPAGDVDVQTASALAGWSPGDARTALGGFAALGLLHTEGPDRWRVPGCLDPLLRVELAARERPGELMLARARMLERTVRQLRACWAAGEPAGSPARRRLADLPRSLRFEHPAEARGWLAARRPALLAAAAQAVADGGGELDTLARRLVHALVRCFESHLRPEEAAPENYRLHELVLGVAERGGLQSPRAAALLHLADLDARTGRVRQAIGRYRAALDAARAVGETPATGRALESLGGAYAELGDWPRAADWYGRALSLRLSGGELAAAARLHGLLGTVHTRAGHWDEALREWRAAASAHRRLREPWGHAHALGETARVQEYAGLPHEAARTCQEALPAARRAGDVRLQAALRLRLADACERIGDHVVAGRHRAAARLLLERPGEEGNGIPAAGATDGGSPITGGAACESNSHPEKD